MYDDLLAGLGDGMAAGSRVGPRRDRDRHGVPPQLLRAGPRRVHRPRQQPAAGAAAARCSSGATGSPTWFLRERDLRGFVPGKGWAHAVAHGADALGALAGSPHCSIDELTRAARRDRRPAAASPPTGLHRRRARPAGAGHDAGAAPQPGAVRACSSRGWTRLGGTPPAAPRRTTTVDPYLARRQRRRVPARALPPARARAAASRGPRRPAARSWSTRSRRPTRTTSAGDTCARPAPMGRLTCSRPTE